MKAKIINKQSTFCDKIVDVRPYDGITYNWECYIPDHQKWMPFRASELEFLSDEPVVEQQIMNKHKTQADIVRESLNNALSYLPAGDSLTIKRVSIHTMRLTSREMREAGATVSAHTTIKLEMNVCGYADDSNKI